jgi:paraquat-inducible protein A
VHSLQVATRMPPTDESADARLLRECPDCGLFQYVPMVASGEGAECVRCECTLRRRSLQGVGLPLFCVSVATVLLAMALYLPIMSLHVLGRYASATVLSGPQRLAEYGTWELTVLVIATLMVVPVLKLAVMLAALVAATAAWPSRTLAWLFGWLERITPWSMVEVFLVGAGVAYTRLHAIADVEVGPALIAAGAFVLASAAADAVLDREAVWQAIGGTERAAAPSDTSLSLIGCDVCGWVSHSSPGQRCPRCVHVLGHRKVNSIARVWACVVAAAILFVPANILPVMTIVRAGRGGPRTILGGVVELGDNHLWALAVVVFLASIAIPLLKLGVLTSILVLTGWGSPAYLRLRTRMYTVVRAVGRWSMIDIFMMSTLVGLLHMGPLTSVSPDAGSLAFAAVVVLTMIATEALDPRIMWDAARERRDATRADPFKDLVTA